MTRKVMVIGGGGREHAIVRQLAASPRNPAIYITPGNPGTATLACNLDVDPRDRSAVVSACKIRGIDLAIVGPEDPLIAGLADDWLGQI